MSRGLLLSVGLTAAWIALQIAVFHAFHVRKKFKTLTALWFTTLPVYAMAFWRGTNGNAFAWPEGLWMLNGLLVHGLLYGTWVEFFYAVERPVTLRILEEISKAPGGSSTLAQIGSVYGLRHMLSRRLETLVRSGYFEERQGRYFLSPQGRLFAGFYRWGRRAFHAGVRP